MVHDQGHVSAGVIGGSIFSHSIIASAILDCLLHHSTTINIRGESYRLREKKKAGIFQKVKEESK